MYQISRVAMAQDPEGTWCSFASGALAVRTIHVDAGSRLAFIVSKLLFHRDTWLGRELCPIQSIRFSLREPQRRVSLRPSPGSGAIRADASGGHDLGAGAIRRARINGGAGAYRSRAARSVRSLACDLR